LTNSLRSGFPHRLHPVADQFTDPARDHTAAAKTYRRKKL